VNTTDLPSYDQLPEAAVGGRSGWNLFGVEDNAGLLNLQTAEGVLAAASLIRTRRVFSLDAPLDGFRFISGVRGAPRHTVIHREGALGFDDVLDNFYPQGSSQWDSLSHVGYAPGAYRNGASERDVPEGRRNTIEHWARKGIAGRAILLDVQRSREADGRRYAPGTSAAFDVVDLELARRRSGCEYKPGNVMLIHASAGSARRRMPSYSNRTSPWVRGGPGQAGTGLEKCAGWR